MGSILGIFLFPAILIIFHEYISAFVFIITVLSCFILFGYYSYQDLLPILQREQLEEERIFHSFNGDPEKIRFYKGFKKHFDGELNLEQLEQWFTNHPRKHQ
jgi:cytochrome b subunit of formate dehydrogenase